MAIYGKTEFDIYKLHLFRRQENTENLQFEARLEIS